MFYRCCNEFKPCFSLVPLPRPLPQCIRLLQNLLAGRACSPKISAPHI
jgi:hypothetical protein